MPINRLLKEGNFTPAEVERLNRAFALALSFLGLVDSANWQMGDGRRLNLVANLSDQDVAFTDAVRGTLIWGSALIGNLPPWAVSWRIE